MKKYFALFFALVICWMACKKDDNSNEGDNFDVERLVYGDKNVKGGQILVFTLSNKARYSNYTGSFGPNEVHVMRMDNQSELVLIVPALPSGDYTFTLQDKDLAADLTFTVNTDPNLNTSQVLDDFIELINQNQSILLETAQNNVNTSEEEVAQLKSMELEYKQMLGEINEEEAKELAHVIHANGLLDDPMVPLDFTDSFAYLDPLLYPTDEKARIGRLILRKGVVISSLSYGFFHLAAAPEALFTKIAAVAMGVRLLEEMLSFKGLVYQIIRVHGIAQAIEGFERRSEIQFVKGESVPFDAYNLYRPLHKDDSDSDGMLANVVPVIVYFDETWNKTRSILNRIGNWFRSGPPELETYQSPLELSTKQRHKGNPDYYHIENVSNDVALTLSHNDSMLFLTANAENPTSFTFDLVFKQEDFDNEVRKTLNGFVQGADNEYILQLILGNNQQIRSGETTESIVLELRDTAGVMPGQKISFYTPTNQLITERTTNASGRAVVSFSSQTPGNYIVNAVYEGTQNRVITTPISFTVSDAEFAFVIIEGNNQTVFKGDSSQPVVLQLYKNGVPYNDYYAVSHSYDGTESFRSGIGQGTMNSQGVITLWLPSDELYDENTDQYHYNREYVVRYTHHVGFPNPPIYIYGRINWTVNGYRFSDLMGNIAGSTFEVTAGHGYPMGESSTSWCSNRCQNSTHPANSKCYFIFGQSGTYTIRDANGLQCGTSTQNYEVFSDTLATRNGEPTGNSFFFNSIVWTFTNTPGGKGNYIKDDGSQNRKLYPRNFHLKTGNGGIRRVP